MSTIDYNKAIEKYHDSKGRAAVTVFPDEHGLPNIVSVNHLLRILKKFYTIYSLIIIYNLTEWHD